MNQLTITENPVNLGVIAKMAMECLQASPYKVLRRVSCECEDGVLTLKGRLFTFYEKQIAQETVSGIIGTAQVVNQIEVD